MNLEYLKKLDEYVDKGLLRRAEDKDLVQYNYTEKTNNCGLWDEITIFNRGNIYEKATGKLIAKAMPKFLNIEQLSEEEQARILQTSKFSVTEKMDGCLGILYKYKGEIRCNSRGGFDNYVTDKMKELLPKYSMLNRLLEHNTLNVEVISPATRIICDYGDTEELYLITAYSTNTDIGEYSYKDTETLARIMRMPIVEQQDMTWETLLQWQKDATYKHEGFVVRFPNNERVKVKSKDYLRIVRLRCGLTKHRIWNTWKNDLEQAKNDLTSYMNNVPDELSKTAQRYLEELQAAMNEHKQNAINLYEATQNIPTKDLSGYFKETPSIYQSCVYNIRNNKSYDKLLIKLIEPEAGYEEVKNVLRN